jgi:L-ascorbate metabolism protein UlaG (beta-lactamase superfamily)
VFDLPSKKSGLKAPRFHADIIIQSHGHAGHNGAEEFPKEKEFFFIDGPGEYEIKGVYIRGIKSYHDSSSGKKHGVNTVYVSRIENINLCFMGDYGEKELRSELKEELGVVDILFVPIGGESVLDAEAARNLINQIEPAIVIPMHYPPAGGKGNALKTFLSEMGQKDVKPLEKFSVKKKDIGENKTQIVVLSPV